MLIVFEDDIPESHVELAIGVAAARHAMSKVLQQEMQTRRLHPFIVLEDLFPMREMSRASLEQARTAVRAESLAEFRAIASYWSRSLDAPLVLSSAYVFYLVGLHDGGNLPPSAREGSQLETLSTCISALIYKAIGVRATVRASLFHSFFDGIDEGIRQYQQMRLAQMARQENSRVNPTKNRRITYHQQSRGRGSKV